MRKMTIQFSKKKKINNDIFFSIECHIYWLLKSSCVKIFGDRNYCLFSSQKVDGTIIFTDC